MDFFQLLHKAQKNDKNNANGVRCYSTKFEPPKKIKKESKQLSANIKKFLAKKEAEEHKKNEEAKKKKEELLALRAQDKKATRRVNVMLKRTKSANQSVIEDAVDKTHTAVTLAGPDQPDEDDYGYVSQEASAFYNKMMEKYSQMPEEPKFNLFKKKVSTNLNSTKDRVKAALEKEREEAMQPHRRKRRKKEDAVDGDDKNECDGEEDGTHDKKDNIKDFKESKESKPKPKPKPVPPPMSFTDLLKIAEKKQFEPVIIEQKPKEEERLLTKRQKKDQEKEKEWRERREARYREMENREKEDKDKDKVKINPDCKTSSSKGPSLLEKQLTKALPKDSGTDKERVSKSGKPPSSSSLEKSNGSVSFKKPPLENKSSKSSTNIIASHKIQDLKPGKSKESLPNSSNRSLTPNNLSKHPSSKNISEKSLVGKNNGISSKDQISRRVDTNIKKEPALVNGKLSGKPKDLPLKGKPKDLKPKQFPPPDVRGFKKKRPLMPNKGRILDDSEEEYDSELDDFIDDGPEEDQSYSSYIKEIFGYDKSRYRDYDDDVDNMESTFAQQMKEEVISTKIGIMEDLEDMKLEEEQKKKKALMKKKMKR